LVIIHIYIYIKLLFFLLILFFSLFISWISLFKIFPLTYASVSAFFAFYFGPDRFSFLFLAIRAKILISNDDDVSLSFENFFSSSCLIWPSSKKWCISLFLFFQFSPGLFQWCSPLHSVWFWSLNLTNRFLGTFSTSILSYHHSRLSILFHFWPSILASYSTFNRTSIWCKDFSNWQSRILSIFALSWDVWLS